jgi:hypothetical protein
VLSAARTGEHTERRLELTENRRPAGRKAHIARQHKFIAGAAYATLLRIIYGGSCRWQMPAAEDGHESKVKTK